MWEFLKGKKTYLLALIVGITAAAQYLGYPVPEWVYTAEGALGLTTIRHGISNA